MAMFKQMNENELYDTFGGNYLRNGIAGGVAGGVAGAIRGAFWGGIRGAPMGPGGIISGSLIGAGLAIGGTYLSKR